ncbi:hypothetical protein BDM02DRAFT_3110965 [Thelephora ganbajun]|uniref:Uncharacterized protein n=1 Tax=Thelephora ganbajun TaxID=370292 RepID=A0ACB6ZP98_THEGA|nr:hypothetical protein BDM02DRAFT_3110965 [Thelephora ganbajun]
MPSALGDPSGGDEIYSDDNDEGGGDDLSDFDSLFDEPMEEMDHRTTAWKQDPARRSPPRPDSPNFVPGLFFHWPTITVPPDLERQVVVDCLTAWFLNHLHGDHHPQLDLDSFLETASFNDVNQIMLFNRTDGVEQFTPPTQPTAPAWLPCLTSLLSYVSEALVPPALDIRTWNILFSSESSKDPEDAANVPDGPKSRAKRSRQAIINLYHPGEGISDHIDLLDRYDDGIVGVSFISGCVMRFRKPRDRGQHRDPLSHQHLRYTNLYLPARSVVAFVGDARYKWTHGIPSRRLDLVQDEFEPQSMHEGEKSSWLDRQLRLSVTFRWLLPGADIVGSTRSSEVPSD